ncbi:hypothetical protein GCM10009799_34610 [Nocardiopsis rhodophaea]|uniref:Uncharacterized protein n=2 Tax=Nocardiopsis rhodophaea TaxID=280238 RepID=A0ABP5EPS4_9ACTN
MTVRFRVDTDRSPEIGVPVIHGYERYGTNPAGSRRISAMVEYEYRELRFPRGTSRGTARLALAEFAEYGRWELARVRLYSDGSRRVTLRRRIIRQVRTV